MNKYPQRVSFYRANSSGTGVAFQLSIWAAKRSFTLAAANQNGDKSFDWKEGKVNAKLGNSDIGKLLSVLSGRADKADMIHEFNGQVTLIRIEKDTKGVGYWLNLGRGKKTDPDNKRFGIRLELEEAIILEQALRHGFNLFLGWEPHMEAVNSLTGDPDSQEDTQVKEEAEVAGEAF